MIALLRQRPTPLPPAILDVERIPGFRFPQWIAKPVDSDAKDAVSRALQEIEARLAAPRREWIVAILMRLAVGNYPEATKDAQAFGVRISDMADDLMEHSEAHIVQACAEWRKTESWFPKTNELLEKLLAIRCADLMYRHRAQVLLGIKKPRPWELPTIPTPEIESRDFSPAINAIAQRMTAGARR